MGYAQLSEGRVEKLEVVEELNAAIERVFPPGADYPIRLHRDFASIFPPLLMQRRHVNETFINILQNARDAMEGRGGNIYITARCRPDLSVEVAGKIGPDFRSVLHHQGKRHRAGPGDRKT